MPLRVLPRSRGGPHDWPRNHSDVLTGYFSPHTGSAIYVFALVPMFAAPANTTPTFMNLTYTLDSQPAGTFTHTGSPTAPNTSYSPSVVVFQKTGLPASVHSLTVSVGPDSVFLLDYIVYSQDSDFESTGNTTSGGSSPSPTVSTPVGAAQTSPSPSASQCVNPAFTSGSVILLANQPYLPFARYPCSGAGVLLRATLT